MIWVLIVVIFGFFYFYLMNDFSMLYYNQKAKPVSSLLDAIYFSFVTATTTGFGDIVPFGLFKMVAIIEVLFGFLLLAVVTSKLVSIKQDAILSELYNISFQERINKLRSSLLLFRQNVNNIIHNMQEGNRNERRIINNVDFYLVYLENIFNEASFLIAKNRDDSFLKQLDPVNAEIIFNSLLQSLEKLHELIAILNHYKIRWKNDANVGVIKKSLLIDEQLFERLNNSKNMIKHSLGDLNQKKERITKTIIKEME